MNALLRCLALFSVLPVRTELELTPAATRRVLLWFPVLGAALAAVAGLIAAAVLAAHAQDGLIAAVLAMIAMTVLTRGLHLDGLADTADGLGSRAPAERALQIMRQSDIGPFGVTSIVLALGVDVAALTQLDGSIWRPLAVLVTAAITSRAVIVAAATRLVPSARGSGFGALVAGSMSTFAALAWCAASLGIGAALAVAVHASVIACVIAQVVAYTVAAVLLTHVIRRIGGVSGDVFGALIEVTTAVVLVGAALF